MNNLIHAIIQFIKIWLIVCFTLLVIYVLAVAFWWHSSGKEKFEAAQTKYEMLKQEEKEIDNENTQETTEEQITNDTTTADDLDLDNENSAYMTYTAPNGETITIIASDYNGFKNYYENQYTGAGQTLEEVYTQWKGYR